MASKQSKRKRPSKDKHVLKERVKLESEVFDRYTLLILAKMIKKRIIQTVDYPVSTGKEANLFRATNYAGEYIAVKIYKIETAPFARKEEYLMGDPRFANIPNKEKDIVFAFAKKEYKNLKICEEAGVRSPEPLYIEKNVLVMEFLGEEGLPYPPMNMVGPKDEKQLEMILNDIKKMYNAGLVHADISEYNILVGDVPYLIDFGQAVVLGHPNAEKFLERDIWNLLKYFKKYGIGKNPEEVLKWIRDGSSK